MHHTASIQTTKSHGRWLSALIASFLTTVAVARTSYAAPLPLNYGRGPVVSTPKVFVVFWGAFTTSEKNGVTQYLNDLADYLSDRVSPSGQQPTVRQYGVFGASLLGSFSDSTTPIPADTDSNDAAVANQIAVWQSAGSVPAFDSQTIIIVAPRKASCGARHRISGTNGFWAYSPFPINNACGGGLSAQQGFESLSSHEIIEAATDPDLATGWLAASGSVCSAREVCDCDGAASADPTCVGPGIVTFTGGRSGRVAYPLDNTTLTCTYFIPRVPRSLGSFAGMPLDLTPLNCFAENAGGTRYAGGTGCPSIGRWQISLPYDVNGPASIGVRAKSASGSSIASCQSFGVSNQDQLFTSSPLMTAGTSFTTLPLNVPSVPTGGDIFVVCNLGPGSEIGSINW